jgi:peptide-methionine (S)-S-oxide reductase
LNLVKHFFKFHDPTTLNSQGNDRGTQYKSAIFVHDEIQNEISKNVIKELQNLMNDDVIDSYSNKKITTQIYDAQTLYIAQKDHQNFLNENPSGYCNHMYRFNNWPNINKDL